VKKKKNYSKPLQNFVKMKAEDLIPIEQICANYNVELTFIDSLHDLGLVEIITIKQTRFVEKDHMSDIEKMMRLHYDLGINLEGIDAVAHLLKKMKELEEEVKTLKNKFKE